MDFKNKPCIILTGPTAVGKTSLSIALAKAINGEIISADSMQVYRHLDIGTAKINKEEMEGISHYLIDVLDPEEPFSIALFREMALTAMEEIYRKGRVPIIVGGTAFSIQGLLKEIRFEGRSDEIRLELEQQLEVEGPQKLYQEMVEKDPLLEKRIHPHNHRRILRALEYIKVTGSSFYDYNKEQEEEEFIFNCLYFVLDLPRQILYERINQRVDTMIEKGLVEEVSNLLKRGISPRAQSMQGLDYQQVVAYLQGEYSLEEAIDKMKQDTRHFAKRQLTWFRREKKAIWINKNEYQDETKILEKLLKDIKEAKIVGESLMEAI